MSTAPRAINEKRKMPQRGFQKRNPMRKKLVVEMAKGKTLNEASEVAGYSHPNAAGAAIRAMRANGELREALDKLGWNPTQFAEKHLVPMLKRKKTIYFQCNGIVMDKRVVEDTQAQLSAGDAYLKIVGGYAPTQVEHSGVVFHALTDQEQREAKESLQRIKSFASDAEYPLLAEIVEGEE